MLSIIQYELNDKTNEYGQDTLSESYLHFQQSFPPYACFVKKGDVIFGTNNDDNPVYSSPDSGRINSSYEFYLDIAEIIYTEGISIMQMHLVEFLNLKLILMSY